MATEAYVQGCRDGKLPEVPAGTQVALLRQTLLIDNTGRIRPTHVTENLQMRVHQDLDKPHLYELTLQRRDLFAGRNGGLRPVGPDDTIYFSFGAFVHQDFFETKKPAQPPKALNCRGCHNAIGGGAIESLGILRAAESVELRASKITEEARHIINWTEKSYTWGLIQGMWGR
jgi:hypothetical protein